MQESENHQLQEPLLIGESNVNTDISIQRAELQNSNANSIQEIQESEEDPLSSSITLTSLNGTRKTEVKILQKNIMQQLKLFPIFEDEKLAQFSVNYFLYLEFFHMAIRMF